MSEIGTGAPWLVADCGIRISTMKIANPDRIYTYWLWDVVLDRWPTVDPVEYEGQMIEVEG